jgi:ribosomal protein S18 acetylase RimI-like enzyme
MEKSMKYIHPVSSGFPDSEGDAFRIAFANLDDVDALVVLHLKCFSATDHIAVMFGEDFIRAAYKWFVTDSKTFVLVAKSKRGDKLVGFTSLAEEGYNVPMLLAAKWEALRGIFRRPWLIFHPELILRLFRMVFPSRKVSMVEKFAQIAFTAVKPEFRGMGISKALKRESIRVCRERGITAMVTGVRKENLRSKAMNVGAGFVEIKELRTKHFIYLKLDLGQDDVAS